MNKTIGIIGSVINLCAVAAFALCMLIGSDPGSYLASIFIAFGFVMMVAAFSAYSHKTHRAAAFAGIIFGGMYALMILLVYFTQLTTVANEALTDQARTLLDYQTFSLLFNVDLLGYGMMALSTFFIGLTLVAQNRADKALKTLLLIHGVFAVTCFIIPMLGIFQQDMAGGDLIGVLVLEFWCLFFIPIGILSIRHFAKKEA